VLAVNWNNWFTVASGYATTLAVLAGFVVWGWRRLMSEFKPNHGSSLKDALNRIEAKLDDINVHVHEVDSELRSHISYHKGKESGESR
jgi:hypothetical protein